VLPREQASVKRIDRKSDVILLQSLQLLHVLPSNLRPLRPEHCGLARQQRPRWTATGSGPCVPNTVVWQGSSALAGPRRDLMSPSAASLRHALQRIARAALSRASCNILPTLKNTIAPR
jgi:hypothetical protein